MNANPPPASDDDKDGDLGAGDRSARPVSKQLILRGTDEPLPEPVPLRAGPLTMIFEAGDLRRICLGDREIVRRIYVAVRDLNWDTVPAVLSDLSIDRGRDSFSITFQAQHRRGELDFAWVGTIRGDSSGTLTYAMEGVARTTFLRNRLGLCVHHPIRECAGQPCVIEQVDGPILQGSFPLTIAPQQPFKSVRAISHEVAEGLRAEVRFAGEVFEMEDQRNWTDASFKTYSTPLDLPFPVEVSEGTVISQTVTLTLEGDLPGLLEPPAADLVTITLGANSAVPLPPVGLGTASHGRPLGPEEIARLKALHLSHLRLDLDLSRDDFPARLGAASSEAAAVGVPLEVALFLSARACSELESLLATLGEIRPAVRRWLIFHVEEKSTDECWVSLVRIYLNRHDPSARIGAGTNAYFAELNRGRPQVGPLDLVGYSINPQVHAFDNVSLIENLHAQAATVESARRFFEGLPVVVGPITLRPRFNPNATGPEPVPVPGALPPQVDTRQISLFGAGWTLGSLKSLALAEASSLTYYETTGWRGVMETDAGSTLSERFPSLQFSVFPLYHVLADVGEFAGGWVIPTVSSDPLSVNALGLRRGDRTRMLVANYGPQSRRVRILGLASPVQIRVLDETNAVAAMRFPEAFRSQADLRQPTVEGCLEVDLRPFGIVRIESGGDDS
jgi:hypothetical protein